MPPFNEAIAADAAKFLATFGETVIRWPLGDASDAENVTAIVDLSDETTAGQIGGGYAVRDEAGERISRTGFLQVAAAQELDDRDRWLIYGERWLSLRIIGRDAGLIRLKIERTEGINTAKGRRRER